MTGESTAAGHLAEELLELYPIALPQVYGFLLARCGDAAIAEDLTADAFMAAVSAIRAGSIETISTGWLIVVARRRLVDHWRKEEREQRSLRMIHRGHETDDPWDEFIEVESARAALTGVAPHYRAALSLRYLDGLSVPEVADLMERSVHSTEALLQRARAALRNVYLEEEAR